MKHIEILVKEYESLRQEIIASMNNRVSILSFGLAGIGAVLTTSLATYYDNQESIFSPLILMLIVPAISNLVLFMWLGEYQRMQRAGRFIMGLEKKINNLASAELLTWETHLREVGKHMIYPYNTTVMLLVIISGVSIIISTLMAKEIKVEIAILIIVMSLSCHFFIFKHVCAKIRRLKE